MENGFAKRLKILRTKLGLKQATIANHLGVANSTYSQYENGLREPNFETLKQLSDIFDVSLEYLLTGEEFKHNKIVDVDKKESALIYDFRRLNSFGKDEAVKRVEELTEIPKYTKHERELLNAAHAYEGKSKEEKQHDDEIMERDEEWI